MISNLERFVNPSAWCPLDKMTGDIERDVIRGVPSHVVRFIDNKKAYYIRTNSPVEVFGVLEGLAQNTLSETM